MASGDVTKPATDWKSVAATWLFGQPAIVILLFACLGMAAWSGRYLITVGVPAHLAQIKAMVTELELSHQTERKEADIRHTDTINKLGERFDKAEERHERWMKSLSDRLGTRGTAGTTAPKNDDGGGQ